MKSSRTHSMPCLLKWLLLVGFAKAQLPPPPLKSCSRDNLFSCPRNSLCTEIGNSRKDAPKCVCLESFYLNPGWMEYENFINSSALLQENYCRSADAISKAKENKLLHYIRSPARKEHLAFGILMVLLAASVAIVIMYGLKVLNPVKRSKSLYKKLKYKRRNTTPLQEMDELELNRRYEMQTL